MGPSALAGPSSVASGLADLGMESIKSANYDDGCGDREEQVMPVQMTAGR